MNIGVKELPYGYGYDDVFKYGDNYFDFPVQELAGYHYGYGNDVFSGCSSLTLKEKKKLKETDYTDSF